MTSTEDHDPINLENSNLFLPESIARTGIRRGTGTAVDPYVIDGWTIKADRAHGIRIKSSSSFFELSNISIGSTDETSLHAGIRLMAAPNVRISNITMENLRAGIEAYSSDLVIVDSTFRNITRNGYTENLELIRPWGARAAAIYGGNARIERTRIQTSTIGILVGGSVIRDVIVRDTDEGIVLATSGIGTLERVDIANPPQNTVDCWGLGSRSSHDTTGVLLAVLAGAEIELRNASIRGFSAGLEVGQNGTSAGSIRVEDSLLQENSCAMRIHAMPLLTGRNVTISHNNEALALFLRKGSFARATFQLSRFVENAHGIYAGPYADEEYTPLAETANVRLDIRQSDIVDNANAAVWYEPRSNAPSKQPMAIDGNYWGPTGPLFGVERSCANCIHSTVHLSDWSTHSFTGYVGSDGKRHANSPGLGPPLIVAAIALAALVCPRWRH